MKSSKGRLENGPGGVKAETEKKLEFYESIGKIIWYERLNAGKPSKFVKGCRPGTYDFQFLMGDVVVVLLETKREGHGIELKDMDYEQRKFVEKFNGLKNVLCFAISHEDQLDQIIEEINDRKNQRILPHNRPIIS